MLILARGPRRGMEIAYAAGHVYDTITFDDIYYGRMIHKATWSNLRSELPPETTQEVLKTHWKLSQEAVKHLEGTLHVKIGRVFVGDRLIGVSDS